MKNFLYIFIFILYSAFYGARVNAVPVEGVTTVEQPNEAENSSSAEVGATQTDLQVAGLEAEANIGAVILPDQTADAANYDPNIYSGFMSPDVFRQYVNQFGGPYTPYAASYAAAYPAPVGYAPPPPPPYPSPFVVQTGYDGFLVPTTNTVPSSTSSSSAFDPLTYLRSLIPNFMLSTVFRILAAIVSAIGVVFFGGAITTAICSITPICDISFKAVTYMRRSGSTEGVGKMIAEEVTPERVRRASEFVWKAIRKYNALQKALDMSE